MTPSRITRSVGILVLLSMMALSAQAGVMSTATATHTLTIESITGAGAGDLFIESSIFDSFSDTFDPEGVTSVMAVVPAVGVLGVGDSITSSVSAVAERLTVGATSAAATLLTDISFDLAPGATGSVEITMTYSNSISATVVGSGPAEFGLASSGAAFTDFFSNLPPVDVVTLAEWDSEFDGGDGSGIPFQVGLDVPGTLVLTLNPGESAALQFDVDAVAFAEVAPSVVPEPASMAVWLCLGMVATGATCRRRRRKI